MKRRDFLKSVSALAASTAVTAPAVFSTAKAQSRQETLLIVSKAALTISTFTVSAPTCRNTKCRGIATTASSVTR